MASRSRRIVSRPWSTLILVSTFLVVVLAAPAVTADENPLPDPPVPTRSELVPLVDAALSDLITEDNKALVESLLRARLGTPVSQSFNLSRAVGTLFGGQTPTFAPDCQTLLLPSGDPDQGDCDATSGVQIGPGAFAKLSFSKNRGLGNIRFMRRPADQTIMPSTLMPVSLSNAQAYQRAVQLLVRSFGLPGQEVPQPPTGVPNPYPVRDLVMGWQDGAGIKGAVATRKIVSIRRGLLTDIPELLWVPAVGDATVVLDDTAIWQAGMRNWQELRPHPRIHAMNAKSRSALIDEIVDDLLQDLTVKPAHVRSQIVIASEPNGTHGLLVPAIQVSIALVPPNPTEAQQAGFRSTAGEVREFMLVEMDERSSSGGESARDEGARDD